MKAWRGWRYFRVMHSGDLQSWRILAPIFQRNHRQSVAWYSLERRPDPARGNLQHRAAGAARQTLAAAQPVTRHAGASAAHCAPACATTKRRCSPPIAPSPRAVDEGRGITPAAEWVLDNYHVVEEQIREIREDLPPGFYRQLPKLAERTRSPASRACSASPGPSSRTPTAASIPRRCGASSAPTRRVQPLTIGELWAVAITLRIVLVENLRRLAAAHRQQPRGAPGGRRAGRPPARASDGQKRRTPDALALASRRRRCRRRSPCSSSSGCATRIPRSRRRCAGWRAARGARHELRRAGPGRAPAPGRLERHGAQHHHQHAADVGRRLGRVLRERQPGRRGAARGRAFAAHGLRHPQPATATRSRSSRAARRCPSSRSRSASLAQRAAAAAHAERERDPGFHLIADGRAGSSAPSASTRRCATGRAASRSRSARATTWPRSPSSRRSFCRCRSRCCSSRASSGGMLWLLGAARRRSPPSTSRSRSSTAR